MQSKSEVFERILRNRAYCVRTKAVIGDTEYTEGDGLVFASVSGGVFAQNGPSVGGCVSREVSAIIMPTAEPPRMAKIRLFCRVELGSEVSEWLPKGVFYIDTRTRDEATGLLTIHGYDRMIFANGEYIPDEDVGEWPRSADSVVEDIADLLGLELDERTAIDPNVMVPYPNDYTMREVLGHIAAAHAGNWTVTDAGKLRLVPMWSIPDYVRPVSPGYLVDQSGAAITFGGVRILV